jgi:glycosyltransferase involved in cell wall biosynthesis
LYKKFTGHKGNINAGFLTEKGNNNKKWKQNLSLYVRGNLFIPDAKKFWIRPSVQFLKEYITKNKIDTLITTGPPHSLNIIGLKLKQQLNIRWIADFRDPWTSIDFYKDLKLSTWADKKHHHLEKQVLTTADHVVVIGETMRKEFMQITKKDNISVITNGYDAEDFEGFSKGKSKDFIITHVGSINKDRNHSIFWYTLAKLIKESPRFKEKIKLKLLGKLDAVVYESIKKYSLEKYVEIIDYLPHQEIIQYLFNADILYLPINNTPNAKGILTGKFFEYLATKNPILAIGPTDGDIAKILKETQAGTICDFNDKETLQKQIQKYFEDERTEIKSMKIEKYNRAFLTEQLISLL